MIATVKDEQKPIALWMRAAMTRHGITASKWAANAKLGRDTVSRAIRDDYEHVTSVNTLVKLAAAIDEPPPLSLEGVSRLPSPDAITSILEAILRLAAPNQEVHPELTRHLALALRDTLSVLALDAVAASDPAQSRMVAKTALHQRLHPTVQ